MTRSPRRWAHGVPAEVLTDNGKQFTGRFTKPRPAEVLFERVCREHGITAQLTKPYSPTTTGKVERCHQTLRRELFDMSGRSPTCPARRPPSTPGCTPITTRGHTRRSTWPPQPACSGRAPCPTWPPSSLRHGQHPSRRTPLRDYLEEQGQAYVLRVPSSFRVTLARDVTLDLRAGGPAADAR